MPQSYFRSVIRNLDTLEHWRREKLSPEERAAEDRADRRRNLRAGVLLVAAFAISGSVTLLPWVIGMKEMGSWMASKVFR